MFADDVLIFCKGIHQDQEETLNIVEAFLIDISLNVNYNKSSLIDGDLPLEDITVISTLLSLKF